MLWLASSPEASSARPAASITVMRSSPVLRWASRLTVISAGRSAGTARRSACATLPLFGTGTVVFARQANAGAFQLLVDLGNFGRIQLRLRARFVLADRGLPLAYRLARLPQLEVDVAQVIMHRRILADPLKRLHQQVLGFAQPVLLVVDPSQAIEVGA